MQIISVKIENYRGLNIEINEIQNVSILIGQNDSGKTNICNAILKVLDYNTRKRPLLLSDSTDSNGNDIEITIKLLADDLTIEQLALVGNYIHIIDSKKIMEVKLHSVYNKETMEYEDTLLYGNSNMDFEEVKSNIQTQLDKVLSIIYINPVYNINQSKKDYFKFKEILNKDNDNFFSKNITGSIENLNTTIQNEKIIKEMQDEINENGDFAELLDNVKFIIKPTIREENIYNSIDVNTVDNNDNEIENIGDGKSKIFSMLLKSKTYNDERQKIYIIEEPENHLYVLLQRKYIATLLKMKPSQIIVTTHSPYTIDFEKTKQIIKLSNDKNGKREIFHYDNINNEEFINYGYLINVEVAEMLYYDKVLLVEGDSEKYFYSFLMSRDEDFFKKVDKNRLGIYSVSGIAFGTIKKLLESLGIIVYIKTDNDIFQVSKKHQWRYAGLERAIEYVNEQTKESLKELLNLEDLSFKVDSEKKRIDVVENNISKICDLLYKEHIIFSEHHDGFEKDFIDFIKENNNDKVNEKRDIAFLKKAKLKNLHSFIVDNDIDIKVNELNKGNVLVRFLYDE